MNLLIEKQYHRRISIKSIIKNILFTKTMKCWKSSKINFVKYRFQKSSIDRRRLLWTAPKGQIISKANFEVFI